MTDLGFVEEVEEREYVGELKHTKEPLPGAGTVDWSTVRAHLQAHVASKRGQSFTEYIDEDGIRQIRVDDVERAAKFHVVSSVEFTGKLPLSPKKVNVRAAAMGWEISVQQTVTHHENTYMAKDGKVRQDGTQSFQGELKKAAHDQTHLYMTVVSETYKVAFVASWLDNGFEGARIRDSVGVPVENYVEYGRLEDSVKPVGYYNDGTMRIEHDYYFKTATPFMLWLEDWVGLIAPEFFEKQKKKAVPKTKQEKADDKAIAPLETGEWIG